MTHRSRRCPAPVDLHGALSAPSEYPDVVAHISECVPCRRRWNDTERMVSLARAVPTQTLDPERKAALRASVLVAAREDARSARNRALPAVHRAAAVAIIGSVGLVFVALFFWNTPAPPTTPSGKMSTTSARAVRGTIKPAGEATFVQTQAGDDEIVRVIDGVLFVDVEPLTKDERFVVATGDAEVEVRGTTFEVTVNDDRLHRVWVIEGVVDVRPKAGPPVTLRGGERWEAPGVAPSEASPQEPVPQPVIDEVGPRRPVRKARARRARLAPSPVAPTVVDNVAPTSPVEEPREQPRDEQAFARGWKAMKSRNYTAAESEFATSIRTAPNGSLAGDSRFWRAMALKRLTRFAEAEGQLQEFVRLHPASTRRGEATVALGWLRLRAGDLDSAEKHFRTSLDDPNERVHRSARDGLDAVAERRR